MLYNNEKELANITVGADCDEKVSSWDGIMCVALQNPPDVGGIDNPPPFTPPPDDVRIGDVNIGVSSNSTYTGEPVTITWSCPGPCVGTNFDTGNQPSGSVVVYPTSTTVYTVTYNGVSAFSDNATVVVKKKPIFIED